MQVGIGQRRLSLHLPLGHHVTSDDGHPLLRHNQTHKDSTDYQDHEALGLCCKGSVDKINHSTTALQGDTIWGNKNTKA